MIKQEVVIVGGGLAGLIAAIQLSKIGIHVVIFEKNTYPKHKVCGEYISNEVLEYFKFLEVDIELLKPTNIQNLHFSTTNGKSIYSKLPLGGFGVSRYALDEFLYKKALFNGCKFINENVENIIFEKDKFSLETNSQIYKASMVIGAFGKRSNIDQKLNRNFITKKSNWLGVKAHYTGVFNENLVGLHNFNGGYCGVSKVENNKINICYLANYETFKEYKNIDEYQKNIVCENPFLKNILENSTLIFDKPMTISQISFENKKPVENHILMIGDTAGLIHPLCGNGMAMAIHSAKIVSELIHKFYENKITTRLELENNYSKQWNYNFKSRLKFGRIISKILQQPKLSSALLRMLIIHPSFLSIIIKKTHGKTI